MSYYIVGMYDVRVFGFLDRQTSAPSRHNLYGIERCWNWESNCKVGALGCQHDKILDRFHGDTTPQLPILDFKISAPSSLNKIKSFFVNPIQQKSYLYICNESPIYHIPEFFSAICYPGAARFAAFPSYFLGPAPWVKNSRGQRSGLGPGQGQLFWPLKPSFSDRRKKVKKKWANLLFAKEKGLYICTPQTRWPRPPRARKNVHVQTKKRKAKFSKKKFCRSKKRLYVCSRKKRQRWERRVH
ncbi:hypothetical protein LX77_02392 [Gelidibacter algens]|uniref:Uncharacterized protein n=1 Tax=Gelidibacter algens TaxID=49280 RepID=A0A327S9J7_9FLAO|nr:hypothetical protein LX77_02392 [Gelidibacter algens]